MQTLETVQIDRRLSELLSIESPPFQSLFESARYTTLSKGKRLRPKIVIAIASHFGVSEEAALDPACAIELVHTYSLIHDDLPCMDNDDFRRGKPTLHRVYGEAHAILTGDFLLTYAFETLSKSPSLSPSEKLQLIQCLSKRAGVFGMVGGQSLDLNKKNLSKDTFWEIYKLKTAALFSASFEFGAILAHHPEVELFSNLGEKFGIAFQLIDDILDENYFLSPEETKKKAEHLLDSLYIEWLFQNVHPLKELLKNLYDLLLF